MFGSMILALLPVLVAGELANNLVYRSPYSNHEGLVMDTHAIEKRHLEASSALRKRQAQTLAPSGTPDTYIWKGDYATADWSSSSYIYAGAINFTHSVASGDPFEDSVILWTRAYPTDAFRVDVPVCVKWAIYTNAEASGEPVNKNFAYTSVDVDFTVKVEARDLQPYTQYFYQFTNCAGEGQSPIGRTKTAPAKDGKIKNEVAFAIYSCANYPNGFFSAYSGPTTFQDVDYVLHLGDYIYEGKPRNGADPTDKKVYFNRTPEPNAEIYTISDYRQRYASYRTDPDLLANHANFPWIQIWDDHETANNDFKAGSSNSNDTAAGCHNGVCFTERESNAKRAYYEWIPIRQVNISDGRRIWRDFQFGDLVSLHALDTRKYDRDITDLDYNTEYVGQLAIQLNTTRSLTGPVQEAWLLDGLSKSKAKGTAWRLLLNQVIMGSINETATDATGAGDYVIDYDAWDGYQGQRARILKHIYDEQVDNVVAVSGDSHANWLFENRGDTVLTGTIEGSSLTPVQTTENKYVRGQVVEFAGTAVSSSGYGYSFGTYENATTNAAAGLVRDNAGLLWGEGFYRGYMRVSIGPEKLVTQYFAYPSNFRASKPQERTLSAEFTVLKDQNMVRRPLQSVFGAIKQGNV